MGSCWRRRDGTVPGAHSSAPAPMPPPLPAAELGGGAWREQGQLENTLGHPCVCTRQPGSLGPGGHPRVIGRCPGRKTLSPGQGAGEALVRRRALLLLQDFLLLLVDTPVTHRHSLRTRKQQHREHFICKYSPCPTRRCRGTCV